MKTHAQNPSSDLSASDNLIPVFDGEIAGQSVQLVDARQLYSFLEIARDFTTWIKKRISDYGFTENQDYLLTKTGEQLPSGTKYRSDYHLTLDTAKELSMVERNEKGRTARRYFIDCEKRLLEQTQNTAPLPMPVPEDPANSTVLTVCNISIRQDIEGRYCLNDLHLAAGNEDRHHLRRWVNLQQTIALAKKHKKKHKDGIIPSIHGIPGVGTFIGKELVYAYAKWVGSAFHISVIRAFDKLETQQPFKENQKLALALKALPNPEPDKPTLQNGVLTATFDDGRRAPFEVQFSPEAWINASAIGAVFGVSVQEWLGQESTLELIVALYRLRHLSTEHLIIIKRDVVWLHRFLAIPFAAAQCTEFSIWCHLQIERLINDLPTAPGAKALREVHMLVSYDMLTGKTTGIGLPNDYRVNTEEGFVDHMMKNGPHRLMNMIADYAAKGPSGRAE
ncbi:antA/AntB antirepressor family protein [Candidatus Methylospira mobilis]|uniref:antA/AntB antirepressor family protein n=1 Tax=Candidatus Methylospira mobilis TaxID=1808979 RepID=UPI0028E78BAE|nr:antA/AntB antirepressor family protein [Candidatus Methylospira mobilis]WNV05888.1 antA/AntB antirepressor family protein [Candidatus Methylospira mobilis]